MNPQQFEIALKQKQEALRNYVNNVFPRRAGEISLRFISGNFRAQGWQGTVFQKWKENRRKGTILVKTGRGRRGTHFTTFPGGVRVFNNVGYMAVHNKGFNGTVQVPAHERRIIARKKVGTGLFSVKTQKERVKSVATVAGVSNVKAHSRKMNIPKRQFMPTSLHDSPVLANALTRELTRALKQIFE
jgi:phage gpG-like protein